MKIVRRPTPPLAGRWPRLWENGSPTTAAWLAGVSLLSLLLHLPFLGLPMINDEGGYAYVAQRWLDGRGTLYDDIWVSRPQGIFVAYGLIFQTIGTSTEAIRLGAWVFSIGTLLFVWLYARDWAGRRVAMAATLIFAILSGSPMIEGFTANAEVFMALPAAASAWMLLRAGRRGWPWWQVMLAGALASASALLKPSGIVMIPVALLYVWLVSQGLRPMLRRAAWVSLGIAIPAAASMLHGWLIGWHDYLFASVTYRMEFQSSTTVGLHHHARALAGLVERTWPTLLLVIGALVIHWRQTRQSGVARQWPGRLLESTRAGIVARPEALGARSTSTADADVLLRLWLLACLAGIAMGGDWWYHYLIQIAAPFAIWFAALAFGITSRLAGWRRWAFPVAAVLVLLFPYGVLRHRDAGTMAVTIFDHTSYPAQEKVAAYIRENTPREAPIFVAFDHAALYYLGDRPGTYRYMYDQELRAIPEAERELVAMIRSPERPLYIIGTKQRAPFPDRGQLFWNEVAEYYHLETIVSGVPIYKADTRRPVIYTDVLG